MFLYVNKVSENIAPSYHKYSMSNEKQMRNYLQLLAQSGMSPNSEALMFNSFQALKIPPNKSTNQNIVYLHMLFFVLEI